MNQSVSTDNKISSVPAGFLGHPVHFLALGFGIGYVPKLPGTAGSVAGILVYVLIGELDVYIYLGITAILFIAGVGFCGKTARDLGVHDHPVIVWDEIVGYLVTMIAAPHGWPWVLSGFILFRLFDIWKPWPIRWIDHRIKGGFGIMLDDVIAGLYGFFGLQLIIYLL
jgi:phosphatidylglycerophosphatase A